MNNCKTIIQNREWTRRELSKLGFISTNSMANFVFAKHEKIDGSFLYEELKRRGILVRHFSNPKIARYNRITIGTITQMQALIDTIKTIVEECNI